MRMMFGLSDGSLFFVQLKLQSSIIINRVLILINDFMYFKTDNLLQVEYKNLKPKLVIRNDKFNF